MRAAPSLGTTWQPNLAFRVIATERFANQLRNAPGELAGYVSAVTAVLRVDPTVASAAFDVVRSGEEYTAISARGRGYLIYWVPAGHDHVLLEWLVWAG
jgi:hypothetical protein